MSTSVHRTSRDASLRGHAARSATIAIVLGASGLSAAACGSLGVDDLVVGEGGAAGTTSTTGTAGGTTTTTSSSSSSGSTTTTSSSSSSGIPITCGNGVLDNGEACDGPDLNGLTCEDQGYVNPAGLACTAGCTIDESGCKAACGNSKAEPGEACDGADLKAHDCTELGYVQSGGLGCANCQFDTSGCKAACGNGKAEPGETCDGADLGGADCTTFGYTSPGGLTCAGNCAGVNQAGCKPTCGNSVLEPTEICEGNNLNGHTCAEFGFANPVGLACSNACALDSSGCQAVCGNGKMEPGEQCDDGNVQSNDGCSSTCKTETPLGTTCNGAIPINVVMGAATILGSTAGGGSHDGSGCSGASGPDRIYALTIAAVSAGPLFLTVSLARPQTVFDSVLYISQNCSDGNPTNTLLCADSYDATNGSALDGGEVVSLRVQAGQKYFVFVDGFAGGDSGNYQLNVDLSAGNCNDPVPIPMEPGTPMRVLGSNPTNATTQGTCGGQPGGEVMYRITRPNNGPIGVTTDTAVTNFNAVLYARSTCTSFASELACSNQAGTAQESITLNTVQGGTPVFVVLDGSSGTSSGNYALTITP